jgi:cytochrome c
VSKVIKGGSGVWGETMMLAHPQLKVEEVDKIVNYILSLNPDKNPTVKSLALDGKLKFNEHLGSDDIGIYILMASYLDKGNDGQENSALSVRKEIVFNPFKIEAENANGKSKGGIRAMGSGTGRFMGVIRHNSYLRFDNINFKDLKSVTVAAVYKDDYHYSGVVEIREDSPTGKIIGQRKVSYYNKNKRGYKYYNISVVPTKEKGSLCLVFKNPEDEEQFITRVNWILLNYDH